MTTTITHPVQGERCITFRSPNRGYSGHVTLGGETVKLVDPNTGKDWYFEWHHYFGPMLVTKTGRPLDLPGKRSRFWDLFENWSRSGRRVDDDGNGVLEGEEVRHRCSLCEGRGWLTRHGTRRKFQCIDCNGEGTIPHSIVLARRAADDAAKTDPTILRFPGYVPDDGV